MNKKRLNETFSFIQRESLWREREARVPKRDLEGSARCVKRG